MALGYELLPDEGRRKLWNMFFDMYKTNDPYIRFDSEARKYVMSQKVTKLRLNGREIRNGMCGMIVLGQVANNCSSHSSSDPSCPRTEQRDKDRETVSN